MVQANGIDICYEEFGRSEDQALLLVNGYRSQMLGWDADLCELLVTHGFHVIRYDNRDVGLTTKTAGDQPSILPPQEPGGRAGLERPAPYTLADMAADGMALLDVLGIDRAHVAGVSMGGMIVQRMAIDHPHRVLSMTSIMSTSGAPGVGTATPEAMAALAGFPPAERDAYVAHSVKNTRTISGPLFDEKRVRDRAAAAYDRCYYPQGALFQMAAVLADRDRTQELSSLRCPVLVIHGRVDPLITLSGGEATAAAISGAELLVLDEMGHDLPPPLWPQIAAAIARVAERAKEPA